MISREARRFVVVYIPLFIAILLSIRLIRKKTIPQQPGQQISDQQTKWTHYTLSPKWTQRPHLKDAPPVAKHIEADDGDGRRQQQQKQQQNHEQQQVLPPRIKQKNKLPLPTPPLPNLFQTDQAAHDNLGVSSMDPWQEASQAVPDTTHVVVSSLGALNPTSKGYTSSSGNSNNQNRNHAFTPLVFGGRTAINPSVLPHPSKQGHYVIVAQEHPPSPDSFGRFTELTCDAAVNLRGELACVTFPIALAIEPTRTKSRSRTSSKANACHDASNPGLELLEINQGPHDARVFFGPGGDPLVVYGSNSGFTCFGQWVQDFRAVSRWDHHHYHHQQQQQQQQQAGQVGAGPGPGAAAAANPPSNQLLFTRGTELQRPRGDRYTAVEKNFFLFWDREGVLYAHHNMHPSRVLGRLGLDGSVDRDWDLGPDTATADADRACMARYLPALERVSPLLSGPGDEDDSIHQSTNSLAVTMCRRADTGCRPGPENTFIATMVNHKRHRRFRSSYEPYVVLFRQSAPFALHAVSKRPLWVLGRRRTPERTEMFYIMSLNWMKQGQGYHGYLDDVILAGFGIEDARPAVLDVTAEELFQDLVLC